MNYLNSVLKNLKTKSTILLTMFGLTLGFGGLALSATAFAASPTIVYNAITNPLPPNVVSLGFEATSTSEFGDYIHLGGTDRVLNTVTVTMSDWALYSDYSTNPTYSGNSASWTYPITLNVYSNHLGANGAPDTLLATITSPITIPWRPAGNPSCPDTGYGAGFAYMSGGQCYNGFAFNATFNMSSLHVTLPNDVIVSVAYNTTDYGVAPNHVPGPYESLNVGVPDNQPVTVGTDDNVNNVFWNTSYAGFYADGGTAGVGIFRQDTNWAPYGTVAFQITATAPAFVAAPHITSPSNGAKLTSAQLNKVNWSNVRGTSPVTYQYQAFSDSGYINSVYSSGWLSTSEIPTPGTPIGNYYIQVRARDGNGNLSQWSNDATNPYLVTVVAEVAPPTTLAQCYNGGWMIFNTPSFNNRDRCTDYVIKHEHRISGDVTYTAYSLKREANFAMNTADNSGYFYYSDNSGSWYNVDVSDVAVNGSNGYFTGVVTKASNHSWVGLWLFAEVQNGHPDMVWGSFTTQSSGVSGVTNMSSPADGPFNVTKGNLEVN